MSVCRWWWLPSGSPAPFTWPRPALVRAQHPHTSCVRCEVAWWTASDRRRLGTCGEKLGWQVSPTWGMCWYAACRLTCTFIHRRTDIFQLVPCALRTGREGGGTTTMGAARRLRLQVLPSPFVNASLSRLDSRHYVRRGLLACSHLVSCFACSFPRSFVWAQGFASAKPCNSTTNGSANSSSNGNGSNGGSSGDDTTRTNGSSSSGNGSNSSTGTSQAKGAGSDSISAAVGDAQPQVRLSRAPRCRVGHECFWVWT